MELLAELEAKLTKTVHFGRVSTGERLDAHFAGKLTGEKISGTVEGIDHITVSASGQSQINVWATVTTDDGVPISMRIKGFSNASDGIIRDQSVSFQTGHDAYKFLCDQVIVGFGGVELHPETGMKNATLRVKYYTIPATS